MTPAKVVEPEVGASVRIEVVLPTLSFTTPLPDSEKIDGELPSRSRTTAVLLIVTGVELPGRVAAARLERAQADRGLRPRRYCSP